MVAAVEFRSDFDVAEITAIRARLKPKMKIEIWFQN